MPAQSHLGGFPHSSVGKSSAYNAGDPGSIPGSGRFPWRKKWQPTPIFLPGESHGQWSLMGYSPWDCKESDMTEQLSTAQQGSTVYHRKAYSILCNGLYGKKI